MQPRRFAAPPSPPSAAPARSRAKPAPLPVGLSDQDDVAYARALNSQIDTILSRVVVPALETPDTPATRSPRNVHAKEERKDMDTDTVNSDGDDDYADDVPKTEPEDGAEYLPRFTPHHNLDDIAMGTSEQPIDLTREDEELLTFATDLAGKCRVELGRVWHRPERSRQHKARQPAATGGHHDLGDLDASKIYLPRKANFDIEAGMFAVDYNKNAGNDITPIERNHVEWLERSRGALQTDSFAAMSTVLKHIRSSRSAKARSLTARTLTTHPRYSSDVANWASLELRKQAVLVGRANSAISKHEAIALSRQLDYARSVFENLA